MKKQFRQVFVCGGAFALLFLCANAYSSNTTVQANGVSAMTLACLNNCSSELYLDLVSSQSGGTTTSTVVFGVFGADNSGNDLPFQWHGPGSIDVSHP